MHNFFLISLYILTILFETSASEKEIFNAIGQGNSTYIQELLESMRFDSRLNEAIIAHGQTLLICALDKDQLVVVQHLISLGIDVNFKDSKLNLSPLEHACCQNKINLDIIEALIKAGAHVNEKDPYEFKTVLMSAVQRCNYPLVKLLLDYGARISDKDMYGLTAYDYLYELHDRQSHMNIENIAHVLSKKRHMLNCLTQ